MVTKVVKKMVEKHGECLYLIFRVLVGLMFFMHGTQKLFGVFGAKGAAATLSLMWFAGLIEFVAGSTIVLGLLTRPMALLGALMMLVAYVTMHFPGGWNPLMNKGELALMYLAAFLMMIWKGAGKWSLEKKLLKKEIF